MAAVRGGIDQPAATRASTSRLPAQRSPCSRAGGSSAASKSSSRLARRSSSRDRARGSASPRAPAGRAASSRFSRRTRPRSRTARSAAHDSRWCGDPRARTPARRPRAARPARRRARASVCSVARPPSSIHSSTRWFGGSSETASTSGTATAPGARNHASPAASVVKNSGRRRRMRLREHAATVVELDRVRDRDVAAVHTSRVDDRRAEVGFDRRRATGRPSAAMLVDVSLATAGGRVGTTAQKPDGFPAVTRHDRTVGTEAVAERLQLLRSRRRVDAPHDAVPLAHPEIVDGPHIEAPELEHQEHLRRPATDAPHHHEAFDDLVVAPPCVPVEHHRAIEHLRREIAKRRQLVRREARPPRKVRIGHRGERLRGEVAVDIASTRHESRRGRACELLEDDRSYQGTERPVGIAGAVRRWTCLATRCAPRGPVRPRRRSPRKEIPPCPPTLPRSGLPRRDPAERAFPPLMNHRAPSGPGAMSPDVRPPP